MAKFPSLCDLQEKNGLDVGKHYRNAAACKTFIGAIADSERNETRNDIHNSNFFSVLSDGSTDSGVIEQESVFVRYIKEGNVKTTLADIVDLESGNAEGVLGGIDKALSRVGVTVETQSKKMVGSNFDGASVMMGQKTGVATRLKERIGNHHVTTHCVAHNLELAIADAIKEVSHYSKFEETVKGIFKFYFYSPKKRRELSQISELLEEDRVRYGGVKCIRWLASQHRALLALQKHYAVTVYHLENTTSSSKGEDGAKAKGYLKELKTERFVKMLHYMVDVTAILGRLSKQFQYEDLFITDIICKVDKAKLQLEDLKKNVGECYKSFSSNYDTQTGNFKCGKNGDQVVKLSNTGVNMEGHFNKLLTDICNYTDSRFESLTTPPISCFQSFDFRIWPQSRSDLLHHGDGDIKTLVAHFSNVLPDETSNGALDQWLDLKLLLSQPAQRKLLPHEVYSSLLANKPNNLSHILLVVEIMMVLSASTAVCERSFSAMNRIKTNLKTNMKQETLQDLLLVSTASPDVKEFSPEEAISVWIGSGKNKRHFVSSDVQHNTADRSAVTAEAEDAELEERPPLPALPALDEP
ncbi:PREDICTED: zinc finger protein 862-like [Acropora digitifera]|nr:PREDICTED: zinc finger protein 862-like [Acropora digitifera]